MSAIIEAASVLLTRGPGGHEVFLVGRAAGLRFMGGFFAFPGGKVHAGDAGLAADLSPRQVAAVRELFEETGVLLAHGPGGERPPADLAPLRRQLLEGQASFRDLLDGLNLHLAATDLTEAGSLVTPAFSPVRFDTTFYVAELPPGQEPTIWPGELERGAWYSADAALAAWTEGDLLLSPPSVSLLEAIRGRAVAELPARLRPLLDMLAGGALPPIWFAPAVQMLPLRCDGLTPGTHTNAYLVGTDPSYLIDPGPTDPGEQGRLFAALDARQGGRGLAAIVLTHHHPDHVGAAAACAARYGVPVFAHALAARALAGKVAIARELADGDRLDLGPAPDGRGRWHLEAVYTPGHAPGHLSFWEPRYGSLFVGDMVSTLSSVLVAPPEGDLALYLASLRRLAALPARLLLPGHGGPTARPAAVLADSLTHRARREAQLLAALAATPRSVPDLAADLYRGLPDELVRFAELQVLGGLEKLHREGKAEPVATAGSMFWRRV